MDELFHVIKGSNTHFVKSKKKFPPKRKTNFNKIKNWQFWTHIIFLIIYFLTGQGQLPNQSDILDKKCIKMQYYGHSLAITDDKIRTYGKSPVMFGQMLHIFVQPVSAIQFALTSVIKTIVSFQSLNYSVFIVN